MERICPRVLSVLMAAMVMLYSVNGMREVKTVLLSSVAVPRMSLISIEYLLVAVSL